MRRFCVESNRIRRTELEHSPVEYANCKVYQDHLKASGEIGANDTLIVLKEGNAYFMRHYGAIGKRCRLLQASSAA